MKKALVILSLLFVANISYSGSSKVEVKKDGEPEEHQCFKQLQKVCPKLEKGNKQAMKECIKENPNSLSDLCKLRMAKAHQMIANPKQ